MFINIVWITNDSYDLILIIPYIYCTYTYFLSKYSASFSILCNFPFQMFFEVDNLQMLFYLCPKYNVKTGHYYCYYDYWRYWKRKWFCYLPPAYSFEWIASYRFELWIFSLFLFRRVRIYFNSKMKWLLTDWWAIAWIIYIRNRFEMQRTIIPSNEWMNVHYNDIFIFCSDLSIDFDLAKWRKKHQNEKDQRKMSSFYGRRHLPFTIHGTRCNRNNNWQKIPIPIPNDDFLIQVQIMWFCVISVIFDKIRRKTCQTKIWWSEHCI